MTEPLCQLLGDWRGDLPEGGAMLEEKHDGWRCLYFRGIDNRPRLFSRQGMPLDGADHVLHRLSLFEEAAGGPLFIDGEIQVDGSLAATKAWFEGGWRKGGDAGVFHAFDVMPLAEWRKGGCDAELYRRKAWLKQLFAASEPVDDGWTWAEGSKGAVPPIAVQIVADTWAFDTRDVLTEARRIWAAGGEGVVLKDVMTPYRRKRSDAWQKVKAENRHKWMARATATVGA